MSGKIMARILRTSVLALLLVLQQGVAGLDSQTVESLTRKHGLHTSRIAICVATLKSGEALFAQNEHQPMVVASNTKLVTTAAALSRLGADYKFETTLYALGPITPDGTLAGDLLVRGSGDPNISGRFTKTPTSIFENWAAALRSMGVKRINGDIVGDDTLFDREFVHPSWPPDQLTFWYTAPVSALSFNDNCVDLTVVPSSNVGQSPQIIPSPQTSYVQIENSCQTLGKATQPLVIYRPPGSNRVILRGHIRLGAEPWQGSITVDNPSRYFVHVLWETFNRCGIRVAGGPRIVSAPVSDAGTKLLVHRSSLRDTLRVMNKRSQNFYAEQVFKLLGRKALGEGSFRAGAQAVQSFLAEIGASEPGSRISDGCGLSRDGRLTASQIVAVLKYMYNSPWRESYLASLPISGEDGTLQGRLDEPPLRGTILAKTGYVAGASALSGYAFATGGGAQPVAFSILVNDLPPGENSKAKAFQDDICRLLSQGGQ